MDKSYIKVSSVCENCYLPVSGVSTDIDEAVSRFKSNMKKHKNGKRCHSRRHWTDTSVTKSVCKTCFGEGLVTN